MAMGFAKGHAKSAVGQRGLRTNRSCRSLVKVYRVVERYWRRMLCSRSWAGRRLTWDAFNQIKERTPLLPPKLRLPYSELQALAVL
jgi:hypothetical protein